MTFRLLIADCFQKSTSGWSRCHRTWFLHEITSEQINDNRAHCIPENHDHRRCWILWFCVWLHHVAPRTRMGRRQIRLELSNSDWTSLWRRCNVRLSRRLVRLPRRYRSDSTASIKRQDKRSNWNHCIRTVWRRVHCSLLAANLVPRRQRCISHIKRDYDTALSHFAAHSGSCLRECCTENRILSPRGHWGKLLSCCRSSSDVHDATRHIDGPVDRLSNPARNWKRIRNAAGEYFLYLDTFHLECVTGALTYRSW